MSVELNEVQSTLLEVDRAYRGEGRPKFIGDVVDGITQCVARRLLRAEAFIKHTTIANQPKYVLMTSRYPFTPEGDRELAALHESLSGATEAGSAAADAGSPDSGAPSDPGVAAETGAAANERNATARARSGREEQPGPPQHPADRDHTRMTPRELTHYLAGLTALAEAADAPDRVAEKRREVELAFGAAQRRQLIRRIVWTALGVVAVAVIVLLLSGAG